MLRAIKGIGYDGWLTIELYPYVENPDEAARRGLERITGDPGRRMNRLQAYAQLVRLPNLPTALADILLGFLATGSPTDARRWPTYLLLMAASACLYCGGMVWNDYFDRDLDKRERPERPHSFRQNRPATGGPVRRGTRACGDRPGLPGRPGRGRLGRCRPSWRCC